MSTYYKYAERDAASQINWAEVGKNMSDMLANENKIREEKKAAIDKASRDFAEVLANSPTGESESARAMALKYGDDASQFMYMQDKLLKSGQLKLSDYTYMRQNLLDDTDNAFGMLKEYQAKYKEKMDRYKQDASQKYELEAMERVEGFGKFSESGMYIDPTTGKVSMAMKEYDPATGGYIMPENPNKRASISTVKGLLQGQWDKYKPATSLDAAATAMGENIQTIRRIGKRTEAGEIMTVTDVLSQVRQEQDIKADIESKTKQIEALQGKTDKKSKEQLAKLQKEVDNAYKDLDASKAVFDFQSAETKAIGAMLANPWDKLSLLTDSMVFESETGTQYYFERDPAKAAKDPAAILMVPSKDNNGSEEPKFTPEQEKAATEWMRSQLRMRYDYKEQRQTVSDYQAPQQQQEWQRRYGDEQQQRQTLINAWKDLRSGTLQQKQAALEYLNGSPYLKQQGLGNLKYTDNGNSITFDYVDPKTGAVLNSVTKPLIVGGQALSGADWLTSGSEAFGNLTVSERNKYSGGEYRFDEGQEKLASSRQFTPQAPAPADVDVSAQVKNAFSNISASVFDNEQDEVAQELSAALSPYGINVTPSGTLGDYVTIEIPGVASKEFPVDATTDGGAVEYKANISNWLNENLTKENSKGLQGGGVGGKYNE